MEIILFLAMFGLGLLGFNWLMGYRKDHITIDFDERYMNFSEYVKAIEHELAKQGREVSYKGNRTFIIDGRPYIFIERNISMGGVPLQRTILKPEK
ncbi:hypothetical protein J7I93_15705 [Bacillus sp. ISL-47]|uniref:hypothetical protein n=1 Tax=Bacillus sp. ISL-47 TaxID=2819130 RepID=UPI001BE7A73A|nr:hypothetical protein [Bacillus sp. ISL-47]MBT2689636.1 hypothetical protein [Bacillus sp. ISL-47]MBT2709280.1 hypothetical protein [Pseudomonas sp. ISL-84]